jgi:hypothetical protein
VSTYTASVRVEGGMLHTSRPLTAPEPVGDMIDRVVYDMTQTEVAAVVTSVELVVETAGESETPIGDSVQGTSSTPLEADPEPAAEPTPVAAQ